MRHKAELNQEKAVVAGQRRSKTLLHEPQPQPQDQLENQTELEAVIDQPGPSHTEIVVSPHSRFRKSSESSPHIAARSLLDSHRSP